MSNRGRIVKIAGSLAAAGAVAGVAAGAVAKRRVSRQRAATAAAVAELGSLHSDPIPVRADDGVLLHAEVDDASGGAGPTLVFIHGYALNLDCWHYQRAALRGRHTMVFYDQRSHGRSGRSSRENATIDQLGSDLRAVLDQLVPEGPVILVGHSMGGMTIMAFAEEYPEMFAARVAGVALIATTAGGLKPYKMFANGVPDRLGSAIAQRLVTVLAAAPRIVDSARSIGSDIGFMASRGFGFGPDPADEQVEFLDQLLAGTSVGVLGEFYPSFSELDKFSVLATLAAVPVVIIGGVHDRLTSIGHSRKMAKLMPTATLIECPDAGHMVIFENADEVNDAIEKLAGQA